MPPKLLPSLQKEMSTANFGDVRLTKRLPKIVSALAVHPGEGLPRALRDRAALEGAYRFMSNGRVTPYRILEPHFAATRERVVDAKRAIVIHDTTENLFGGEREGLGRVNASKTRKRGFFMHTALAVEVTGSRPLGALGLVPYVRGHRVSKTLSGWGHAKRKTKESDRWSQLVRNIDVQLAQRAQIIHVMDREGDQFRVMDEAVNAGALFVIRAMHKDRSLAPNEKGFRHLLEATTVAPVVLEREVHLSARKGKHFRYWTNQPRDGRPARLQVSATTVEIERGRMPRDGGALASSLRINVVRVFEVEPPPGVEAVEWVLLSTLPITTFEDVAFVVDCYRQRWLIEEYFKALKTGCKYEKLQLESAKTLINALALLMPIAWQMLLLRSLSRNETASASEVLTPTQLDALRAASPAHLPRRPTAREALLAMAAMGGHIRNNGEPGWQVLYRGFRDLALIEQGWRLRSDQS